MRRKSPMKRGGPIKRKSAMKPGGSIERKPMKRKAPKPRPPEGPLTPGEWASSAYERTEGREELRGERVTRAESEVHHVLPKSWLRREGRHDLVWDPRNAMILAKTDHDRHESAMKRIPRSRVRTETWAFAREVGQSAVVRLERLYPEEGSK